MAKKHNYTQEEKTYKSTVFSSPVIKVLIILAIVAFILVLFAGDALRVAQAASHLPVHVEAGGHELFVTQSPQGGGYVMTREAGNIFRYLEQVNRSMSSSPEVNEDQLRTYIDMYMRSAIDSMVIDEIYDLEAEESKLTVPKKEFYKYAKRDYREILKRIQNGESGSKRELPPRNLEAHKSTLKKKFLRVNIEKPLEESVVVTDLDVMSKLATADSITTFKYAFYGFDNFVENSVEDIKIEDEEKKLKEFLEANQSASVVTGLKVDILSFETKEDAEKALQEDNPFNMEDNKDKIIENISIDRENDLYDELKNTDSGKHKIKILQYEGKNSIFKVISKEKSNELDKIKEAGAMNDLKKQYIEKNATEYVDLFIKEGKETMQEFQKDISEGKDFFKVAKSMNITICGQSKETSMEASKVEPDDQSPVMLSPSQLNLHSNALRRGSDKGELVLNSFIGDVDVVSELFTTSDNKEQELFTQDDYYYVIQPTKIDLSEDITEERRKTITEELRSELSSEFRSQKIEDLKKKYDVKIDYEKIDKLLADYGLYKPMGREEDTSEVVPINLGENTKDNTENTSSEGSDTTTSSGSAGLGIDTNTGTGGFGLGGNAPVFDPKTLEDNGEGTAEGTENTAEDTDQ